MLPYILLIDLDTSFGQTKEAIIAGICNTRDAVVYTNGSVKRGVKSGWTYYTARVSGEPIDESSGDVEITTSSMLMKVKAITEPLRYLQVTQYKRAIMTQ